MNRYARSLTMCYAHIDILLSTQTRCLLTVRYRLCDLGIQSPHLFFFFFFNDTATPEIYPLPLPDALPIWNRRTSAPERPGRRPDGIARRGRTRESPAPAAPPPARTARQPGRAG